MVKKLFSVDEEILAKVTAKLSEHFRRPINSTQAIHYLLNGCAYGYFRLFMIDDILLTQNKKRIDHFDYLLHQEIDEELPF